MELKDVILSTLAEMENVQEDESAPKVMQTPKSEQTLQKVDIDLSKTTLNVNSDEEKFLQSVRERLLVVFEGFQSPNNKAIEAKVDLTLNFLEYLLSTIDTRIDTINTKSKNETV